MSPITLHAVFFLMLMPVLLGIILMTKEKDRSSVRSLGRVRDLILIESGSFIFLPALHRVALLV